MIANGLEQLAHENPVSHGFATRAARHHLQWRRADGRVPSVASDTSADFQPQHRRVSLCAPLRFDYCGSARSGTDDKLGHRGRVKRIILHARTH